MARTIYTYTCKNQECGKEFTSLKPDRLYCSIKCRCTSPDFKAAALANAVKAQAGRKGGTRKSEQLTCANPECGKVFYVKPSEVKRGKKTCSRHCYRLWLAGRFDRAIAAPATFKEMQGFDEYLTQDNLPCLIEGCTWEGDNLGLHMNQTHGISADDFKRMAGFNLSTGLISPRLEAAFVARGNTGNERTLDQPRAVAARKFDYISKERIEHAKKSGILALRARESIKHRKRDARGRLMPNAQREP